MLGFYNPSVILTYLSLISAGVGFSFLARGGQGGFFAALICLMFSGVCDMFDGAVAGLCKRNEEEKLFGVEIDALCDLVAFGALPAQMVIFLGANGVLSVIAAVAILLSSVIRLGFFNVQEMTRDRGEKREHYLGLPVTMISICFPLLLLCNLLFGIKTTLWAPLSALLLAVLEISPFKLKKPYGIGKLVVLVIGVSVGVGVIVFRTTIGA